jgi:hypothetical protein
VLFMFRMKCISLNLYQESIENIRLYHLSIYWTVPLDWIATESKRNFFPDIKEMKLPVSNRSPLDIIPQIYVMFFCGIVIKFTIHPRALFHCGPCQGCLFVRLVVDGFCPIS